MTAITTSELISDPALLGAAFAGASWATWRAVLAAAEGLPLAEDQRAAFRAVADRAPPSRRVRELWAIVGRRGGKDSVASAIATAAALGDYHALLRSGERAAVLCLACDRPQAKIVKRYISGYFDTVPMLHNLVSRETDNGIELANGVEIIVATNSFRAVRGRTIVCAILDEVAFWRDETSALPDSETYNAVVPGLATLPGAILIGISTPYRRAGLLYDRWRRYYGQPDDDVLVVHGPSMAFNPTLPQSVIDDALARDPEAGAAEWLAEWRDDLSAFISREVIEGCVIHDRRELPRVAGAWYVAFLDPASGGGADSMTFGIAHRRADGVAVLDVLREARPPFDPAARVAEFASTCRVYRISEIVKDAWGVGFVDAAFEAHGIRCRQSPLVRSALYLELLPLLNSSRVELLDNDRLVAQLCGLERRVSRSGKDTVDHPDRGHDDLANAAAGALWLASSRAPVMAIDDAVLARARMLGLPGGFGRAPRAFFGSGDQV